MDCTESYRKHIMYSFNGFCKVVIRYAAINVWRERSRRREKEISIILTNGELAAALLSLPEKKREIIFLYFFGHYTQQEIGEMYGRCRSTAWHYIHSALQMLQKEMEGLPHGES